MTASRKRDTRKQKTPVSFWADFRRFFVRGLATALPTLLTVGIIVYVFNFINDKIGEPINAFLIKVVGPFVDTVNGQPLEDFWNDYLYWVGFVVAVIGVYLIGRLVASFLGRSIWKVLEAALFRTPVVKQIYPNVKQVTDFLLSARPFEFSRVVAVEYPRKGVWSLGLVTGSGLAEIKRSAGANMLTVFIPSSPTPVTGYTITVHRDEVIDLPMSIDEALRFTVIGGVVVPLVEGAADGKASPEAMLKLPGENADEDESERTKQREANS